MRRHRRKGEFGAREADGGACRTRTPHYLFCHTHQNPPTRPLAERMAVVELIAATKTKTGLWVEAALGTRTYAKGKKVSKAEMKALNITGNPYHPTPSDRGHRQIAVVNLAVS